MMVEEAVLDRRAETAKKSVTSMAQYPGAYPSAMNATPAMSVPIARRLRSPKRSAINPAGSWNDAMATRWAERIIPTCARERPKVCASRGRRT